MMFTRTALQLLVMALVTLPAASFGQELLTCRDNSRYMADADIDRSDESGYVNHEFLYTRKGHFWVGVVYEFLDGKEGAVLYEGLSETGTEKDSVQKLTANFKNALLEGSLYHDVEELGLSQSDGRYFATFLAHFYEDTDLYAVHGSFQRGRLTFFRTHTALEDEDDSDEIVPIAIESLNEMIDNCSFNEA